MAMETDKCMVEITVEIAVWPWRQIRTWLRLLLRLLCGHGDRLGYC